jgi:starvation-inducible DNA-binding protein
MTAPAFGADVAAAFRPLLVDLIALAMNGKQAHWHIQGRHFLPIHEQLDTLVADARRFSDEIAERVVALGRAVDGRPQAVAEASPAIPDGFIADEKVVAMVVEQLTTVIERSRNIVDELDDVDLVSEDLVIELVSVLEKHRWMFAAQIASAPG